MNDKMNDKIKRDAKRVVKALRESNVIYTFGNGGSASIADHMACDWMKGTDGRLRVVSLSSNGPLLSAIGNDCGYEHTCVKQLQWLSDWVGDVLVLISSSGTSPNIVSAARYLRGGGSTVIGFSGNAKKSGGGSLRALSTVSVHCDSEDYGVIEDYHSQVMHEVLRQMRRSK